MPSEPIEAEFARPPALTTTQEEKFRQLEQEGPADSNHTLAGTSAGTSSLSAVEEGYRKEGVKIVTFGPGEDPRQFPQFKKWYITLTTSFLCLAVALGSSIATGDITGPTKEWGADQEIVNLTVTCFVIGFGIGPLFFAPLSELVGRTPIYITSMFFYFIFTLPSAVADNVTTLVVARQIAGLAASAPMCNVGGSIADIWSVEERGIPMAIFSFTIFMGPCVGPLIGGFIGQEAGWRWLYWVLFIFAGACTALTVFIPETLAPVILRKKAAKLRKETGDNSYKTLEELERKPFAETLWIALCRPIIMLLTEPIVILFSFYLSFVYALLYLLFFAFPIAFAEIRGFNEGLTGVTFVSIMLGIGGAMCLLPIQEKLYAKATVNGTFPEARLYGMMFGSIYSAFAASALAAKTLLRSEVGAMVPLFVNQMFHNMGFQYAGLLLALVAVAITPIPFVFYKFEQASSPSDLDIFALLIVLLVAPVDDDTPELFRQG
ncbi:hypothetical protein V5O48_002923 [Marasmius crinis-equi]|uniref:Major facilitator superfamily (MFS) profile domain-containing protein n=1 Tax=Marasmius crinis-equi TaxID=585013 RepID=A0ABR3FUA7_9AGAR